MSYLAVKWAYTSREVLKADLKPADLAVLRALCWFARDEGIGRGERTCFPGVRRLVAVTGFGKSAVDAAKERLREKGLITWERAQNFGGKVPRTNAYRINCPALEKKLKAASAGEDDPERTHPLRPGVLYERPDVTALRTDCPGLDGAEIDWLVGALEFVCDNERNRAALLRALKMPHDLSDYYGALNRCRQTSRKGRRIGNRLAYLLKALRQNLSQASA